MYQTPEEQILTATIETTAKYYQDSGLGQTNRWQNGDLVNLKQESLFEMQQNMQEQFMQRQISQYQYYEELRQQKSTEENQSKMNTGNIDCGWQNVSTDGNLPDVECVNSSHDSESLITNEVLPYATCANNQLFVPEHINSCAEAFCGASDVATHQFNYSEEPDYPVQECLKQNTNNQCFEVNNKLRCSDNFRDISHYDSNCLKFPNNSGELPNKDNLFSNLPVSSSLLNPNAKEWTGVSSCVSSDLNPEAEEWIPVEKNIDEELKKSHSHISIAESNVNDDFVLISLEDNHLKAKDSKESDLVVNNLNKLCSTVNSGNNDKTNYASFNSTSITIARSTSVDSASPQTKQGTQEQVQCPLVRNRSASIASPLPSPGCRNMCQGLLKVTQSLMVVVTPRVKQTELLNEIHEKNDVSLRDNNNDDNADDSSSESDAESDGILSSNDTSDGTSDWESEEDDCATGEESSSEGSTSTEEGDVICDDDDDDDDFIFRDEDDEVVSSDEDDEVVSSDEDDEVVSSDEDDEVVFSDKPIIFASFYIEEPRLRTSPSQPGSGTCRAAANQHLITSVPAVVCQVRPSLFRPPTDKGATAKNTVDDEDSFADVNDDSDWENDTSSPPSSSQRCRWAAFGIGIISPPGKTINEQSKMLTFVDKERKNSLTEVEKANLKWDTEYGDDVMRCTTARRQTRIRFDEIVREFSADLDVDRRGYWEVHARDRVRFEERIAKHEKILSPVFDDRHRDKIYKQRFV